jgi:hypothetical protein
VKDTKVTSHLNEKISKGENLIYCSTMQLAWNELCNFFKGDVCFPGNKSVATTLTTQELNKHSFKKTDLDSSSYIAMADAIESGIVGKIKKDLKERFNETSKIDFSHLSPGDVLAYAFLLKVLEFEQKFDEIDDLVFTPSHNEHTPVEAFGMGNKSKNLTKLSKQVKILHYKNPSEFTIL